MNSFEQSGKGLKSLLVSSVAVIGLASTAQAQMAELKRLMDNKDFGGSSSFYLPLGNVKTGVSFFSIGAGLLGGSKSGEALVGFGKGLGDNIGIRGYAGVGLKDSRNNLFTSAKAGVELSIEGLGLNVSGSVPFGKTSQVSSKGHTDVVFVDPTGQQCDPTGACVPPTSSCSNPLPGQPKHCEIGVAVTDPSYEKALKGFEVGLDYQVQVGGVWLRPSLGYYRYGNGVVSGAKAGLEVSVPLTSQLSLNIGAGAQKAFKDDENNKGVSGFGSLGISYHFGGVAVSQLSALEHRFAEAPNRNQRTVTTTTQAGKTTVYQNQPSTGQGLSPLTPMFGVIWDQNSRGHYLTETWTVDATTASQLDDIVGSISEDSIIFVDGRAGEVKLDNTIEFKSAGVGVVGGGSTLNLQVTIDGGKTFTPATFTAAGSRPTITQADKTKDIFYASWVINPIIYGINMEGGKSGVAFNTTPYARFVDVSTKSNQGSGFYLIKADELKMINIKAQNIVGRIPDPIPPRTGGGLRAIDINDSTNIMLENIEVSDSRTGSIFIGNSQNIVIKDLKSINNEGGVALDEVKNFNIERVYSFDQEGIFIHSSSAGTIKDSYLQTQLSSLSIWSSHNIAIEQMTGFATEFGAWILFSDEVTLKNSFFSVGNYRDSFFKHNSGLEIQQSTNVELDNVLIQLDNNSPIPAGSQIMGVHIFSVGNTLDTSVSLKNVRVQSAFSPTTEDPLVDATAFVLEITPGSPVGTKVTVNDLGGNKAWNIKRICDGKADVTNSVKVLNINTTLTETCQ